MAYQTGDGGRREEVSTPQSRLDLEGLDIEVLSLVGHVVDVAVRHVRMHDRPQELIDAAVEKGYVEEAPATALSHGNMSSPVYNVTDKGYEALRRVSAVFTSD